MQQNIDRSNKLNFISMTQTRRTEGVQQPRSLIDEPGDQSDEGDGDRQIDFDKNNSDDEGIDSDKPEENDDDGPDGMNAEDAEDDHEDDGGLDV